MIAPSAGLHEPSYCVPGRSGVLSGARRSGDRQSARHEHGVPTPPPHSGWCPRCADRSVSVPLVQLLLLLVEMRPRSSRGGRCWGRDFINLAWTASGRVAGCSPPSPSSPPPDPTWFPSGRSLPALSLPPVAGLCLLAGLRSRRRARASSVVASAILGVAMFRSIEWKTTRNIFTATAQRNRAGAFTAQGRRRHHQSSGFAPPARQGRRLSQAGDLRRGARAARVGAPAAWRPAAGSVRIVLHRERQLAAAGERGRCCSIPVTLGRSPRRPRALKPAGSTKRATLTAAPSPSGAWISPRASE